MKVTNVDAAEVDDGTCRAKTGKTLTQWYGELDRLGGLAKGRRDLVEAIYDATGKDVWWSTTIVIEYERAKGQTEKDGRPTGYSICSTKTIAAPLDQVFAAFGDAGQLDHWLGARTKVDFKDGGSFENADGDRGTFKKIRANKDIKLTWEHAELAPGTSVEVQFADKGKGKTGVTLNHTRIATRREADRIRAGWSAAFDALKALLEKA
jgi:uncharacterized protein YndB with AHSA1/START domain